MEFHKIQCHMHPFSNISPMPRPSLLPGSLWGHRCWTPEPKSIQILWPCYFCLILSQGQMYVERQCYQKLAERWLLTFSCLCLLRGLIVPLRRKLKTVWCKRCHLFVICRVFSVATSKHDFGLALVYQTGTWWSWCIANGFTDVLGHFVLKGLAVAGRGCWTA